MAAKPSFTKYRLEDISHLCLHMSVGNTDHEMYEHATLKPGALANLEVCSTATIDKLSTLLTVICPLSYLPPRFTAPLLCCHIGNPIPSKPVAVD